MWSSVYYSGIASSATQGRGRSRRGGGASYRVLSCLDLSNPHVSSGFSRGAGFQLLCLLPLPRPFRPLLRLRVDPAGPGGSAAASPSTARAFAGVCCSAAAAAAAAVSAAAASIAVDPCPSLFPSVKSCSRSSGSSGWGLSAGASGCRGCSICVRGTRRD